ncbi:coproporphyrinogen III oxidase [Bacillus sp. DX1.1]|uniref:coproporphyrinogen III oxidase n=1 Tax=unclassified Bacillus (in: firmicutes) TaxID=185979 RepID=UPI00257067CC|nr:MULTISPECIES: coproporphyrinogen III oxidase [unclassified Bacillus (in: firmicutes)]MDM5155808.1 coproporphyrinogen III oxidase [Bacillus sp. DX1.1]WJE80106.1 coproporphyrinogen III oxidase [Bacillus sp. DX3.1]
MALQHEFVFVSHEKRELSFEDFDWIAKSFGYKKDAAVEDCVILSDEIVLYLLDFLNWLPTYIPAKREKGFGIHYYGITKFEKEGAEKAIDLYQSLISIFSLAPEKIELTGSFQWTSDCNTDGEYEKIFLNRDILCAELESLVKLCYKVKEGEGYLLHFGV